MDRKINPIQNQFRNSSFIFASFHFKFNAHAIQVGTNQKHTYCMVGESYSLFLSAFYQYDLRNSPHLITKTNTGWNAIIQFIAASSEHIKHNSWDYYGECIEILNKLGYDVQHQLEHIQENLIQPKIRGNDSSKIQVNLVQIYTQ